jgi:formylglycine-generating enzyme required for sulfatase activity
MLAASAAPASAEGRVALVIGNSRYASIAPLRNPANDARLIADTLRGLGFTLTGGGAQIDLDKAGLDRAVQSFGAQSASADVALFYYAGHGVQLGGANYLVPVDANVVREADASFQMLNVNHVLEQMDAADRTGRLNVVILDACRNNPFGGRGLRSADRGLTVMDAPGGTLISFATQPGAAAKDGDGDHSPFTAALADSIRRPGLDLFQMFNEVGLGVQKATGGTQRPWVSNSPIAGQYYFAGLPQREPAAVSPSPADAERAAGAERMWLLVKDTASLAVLDDFIARYGDVPILGPRARERREEVAKLALAVKPQPPALQSPSGGASPKAGESFKDCAGCPEMVVVPAGSFTMGSPGNEPEHQDSEGPQRTVTIGRPFAVGRFHVTRDQFAAFVQETKYAASTTCIKYPSLDNTGSWRNPGFAQDGSHPVVCVSWDDANAYANWLTKKTGKSYRLLSEAEFEYAARASTTTPFWWGSSITPAQANYDSTGGGNKGDYRHRTASVDSFKPNPWGLYNVHGNAWQWMEDCWHGNYNGAPPTDGTAWTTSCDDSNHAIRGGSWRDSPGSLRAAARGGYSAPDYTAGFRLARTFP